MARRRQRGQLCWRGSSPGGGPQRPWSQSPPASARRSHCSGWYLPHPGLLTKTHTHNNKGSCTVSAGACVAHNKPRSGRQWGPLTGLLLLLLLLAGGKQRASRLTRGRARSSCLHLRGEPLCKTSQSCVKEESTYRDSLIYALVYHLFFITILVLTCDSTTAPSRLARSHSRGQPVHY